MASRSYDRPDVMSIKVDDYTKISGTGSPPADSSSPEWQTRKLGLYSGKPTRDYTKKLAQGELLPLNPYFRYDYEENRNPGVYFGTNKGPNPKYSFRTTSPAATLSGNTMATHPGAVGKLTAMAKEVNTIALQQSAFAKIAPDLDLLTTMAEVPKTLAMILGARKRALELIINARRRGFDSAKDAARLWLEWRYGWRILGYDIENFVSFWKRPFQPLIMTGSASDEVSEMETLSSPGGGYYCRYDDVTNITRNLNVKVNAAIKYSGRNLNVLVSPVTTAWEFVPWSFVGDWFFSVGDVLNAWSVLGRAESSYSSVGYELTENCSGSRQNPVLGTGANAIAPYGATGSGNSSGTLLMRVPLGSMSKVPQLRVNLNAGRIADAVALLWGFKRDINFYR